MGRDVLTTVGSADKAAACRALGADHAIDYKTQDFVAEVLRLTDGKGTDVVLDMVAGEYIGRDVKCLAEDGRIVIIAVQGGAVDRRRQPGAAPAPRRSPARRCGRVRSRSRRRSPRRCARPRGRWLESGVVKPVIHQVFPAAEAAQAHALMESNQHIGKLVLTW